MKYLSICFLVLFLSNISTIFGYKHQNKMPAVAANPLMYCEQRSQLWQPSLQQQQLALVQEYHTNHDALKRDHENRCREQQENALTTIAEKKRSYQRMCAQRDSVKKERLACEENIKQLQNQTESSFDARTERARLALEEKEWTKYKYMLDHARQVQEKELAQMRKECDMQLTQYAKKYETESAQYTQRIAQERNLLAQEKTALEHAKAKLAHLKKQYAAQEIRMQQERMNLKPLQEKVLALRQSCAEQEKIAAQMQSSGTGEVDQYKRMVLTKARKNITHRIYQQEKQVAAVVQERAQYAQECTRLEDECNKIRAGLASVVQQLKTDRACLAKDAEILTTKQTAPVAALDRDDRSLSSAVLN